MIRNVILIISILVISFDFSFANIKNNIVLKVENEIVTNYEIKNKILSSLILSNQLVNQENINKTKGQALESLIQLKLKKIELSKYEINSDQNNVNDYLKSISQNDIKGLKNKFHENNLDYQLFLEEIETQFKWQKYIYQRYSKKISIDEKIIDEELKDLINKKTSIEEFRLSEIEILINNDSTDTRKISEIASLIRDEGFEVAAIKYSISDSSKNKGDIGWVNSKSMSKPIYDIMKNLKVGEVSKPIKRQNSVLFLQLREKKNSKPDKLDIEKLKKDLINQKKNELFNLYSRSHLSKLKNSSLIEYK